MSLLFVNFFDRVYKDINMEHYVKELTNWNLWNVIVEGWVILKLDFQCYVPFEFSAGHCEARTCAKVIQSTSVNHYMTIRNNHKARIDELSHDARTAGTRKKAFLRHSWICKFVSVCKCKVAEFSPPHRVAILPSPWTWSAARTMRRRTRWGRRKRFLPLFFSSLPSHPQTATRETHPTHMH